MTRTALLTSILLAAGLTACSAATPSIPDAQTSGTLHATGFIGGGWIDPLCVSSTPSPVTGKFAPDHIYVSTTYLPTYPNTNFQLTSTASTVNSKVRLVVPSGLSASWTSQTFTAAGTYPLTISPTYFTPKGDYYVKLYWVKDGYECSGGNLWVTVTN